MRTELEEPLAVEEYGTAILAEINSLIRQGIIPLLYRDRASHELHPEALTEVARIKRLLELWAADATVREAMRLGEPVAYDPGMPLADLDSLWNEHTARVLPPMAALRYKAFNLEKLTHRNRIRENDPTSDPRYNAWRSRQLLRGHFELHALAANGIVHAPYCIELSQGCSVGCWFCGISAPKLSDIFFFTPENQQLFGEVLLALKGVLGQAVQKGFCYWATDPMDNPDYEKFLEEFHRITGYFPQTTTALPLKDIERTRALLQLSRKLGGKLDRFSLLSLKQLHLVHEAFTEEELLFVEMVTQNKEAYGAKSKAGRAVEGALKRAGTVKPLEQGNRVAEGTIACVSGWLISLVEKKLKLITPCEACEEWPLGYIVLEEGSFADGAEFTALLNGMVARHMALTLPPDERVAFVPSAQLELHADGFSLRSRHIYKSFRGNALYTPLGLLIAEGTHTAHGLQEALVASTACSVFDVSYLLHSIYSEGVLRQPTLS